MHHEVVINTFFLDIDACLRWFYNGAPVMQPVSPLCYQYF